MKTLINHLVGTQLDINGTPKDAEAQGILELVASSGQSQTDKGFKSNTGHGRIVRKSDNKTDYLELAKLYHAGKW